MKALVNGLVRAVRGFLNGGRQGQVARIIDDLAADVQEIEAAGLPLHDILEREAEALDAYLRGTKDFPIRYERNTDLLARAVIWKTVATHALRRGG